MTGGSCARGLGHASVGISDLGPMGTCHVAQVAVSTTCPDGHGLSIYYNKCREPVWVLEITRAVNTAGANTMCTYIKQGGIYLMQLSSLCLHVY